MPRHRIAILSLLAVAAPLAFAQPATNEGPKSVPKAETPNDAEHAPTQGNTVKDRADDKDKDRKARAGSTAQKPTRKNPAATNDRTQGAQSPDDAEHAPTKKTDDDKGATGASGAKRP